MKETLNTDLMVERLESLKAGMICALSFSVAFILASIVNKYFFKIYFHEYINYTSAMALNWHWLISVGIAGFSGLLFGVTYRYIIREDKNPQLQAGAVFAFGLVRGLALVDMGLNFSLAIFPLTIIALENIMEFAIAAFILDIAIKFAWVKVFVGNGE